MPRRGITIIEVAFVALILFVLGAIVAPELGRAPANARRNHTTFRLQTLRTAVEKYRSLYGEPPTDLHALTEARAVPLLDEVPEEALTGSAVVEVVRQSGRLVISDREERGGWIYNAATGEVRVNHRLHKRL